MLAAMLCGTIVTVLHLSGDFCVGDAPMPAAMRRRLDEQLQYQLYYWLSLQSPSVYLRSVGAWIAGCLDSVL